MAIGILAWLQPDGHPLADLDDQQWFRYLAEPTCCVPFPSFPCALSEGERVLWQLQGEGGTWGAGKELSGLWALQRLWVRFGHQDEHTERVGDVEKCILIFGN